MSALPGRTARDTGIALLATVLLLTLAGCSGISAPGVGAGGAAVDSAEPTFSESAAENRSVAAEREHVRENEIPDDVDSWGWGGLATANAVAVAATDDGRFVRVRVGFYYTKNTSDGRLHADGISQAAYFVTPNASTRVSVRGHEMKGSSSGEGPGALVVRVVNTAQGARDVSLSVQQKGDDAVYKGDTSVGGQSAAHTPRLSVPHDVYEVVATVDGQTERLTVSVEDESGPMEVTVFVAPDGSVVLAPTPGHL